MKKIKFKVAISLLSMLIAWFIGFLFHSVYQLFFLTKSRIEDISFILFWSGLFCLISSITIVPIVIWISNKFKSIFFFIVFSVLASFLVMLVLPFILFGFRPSEMGSYMYIYAIVIGFFFSTIYLAISHKKQNHTS